MRFLLLCALIFWRFNSLAHGEIDARIRAASIEIERATNNAQLYIQRAELHREHRDWNAALSDYQNAERLDPSLVRLDFFRARMFRDAGDADKSRTILEGYLRSNTNDAEAFVLSATLFSSAKNHDAAVTDYSRAIEISPTPDPDLFLVRANILSARNRNAEALSGLDEGIRKTGDVLSLHLRALDLELAVTNHHAALKRLDKIIQLSPRKESWLVRRGEVFMQNGMPDAARKSFEDAANAILTLPLRLQETDAMKKLSTQIREHIKALDGEKKIKPVPVR